MKNSKKSTTPKVTKEVRANPNVYTLSPSAKKLDPKDIQAETHKGACLLALKELGSAPFAEILTEVLKQKTIKTSMDLGKATRWMIGDMMRKGVVVVKE